MSVIRKRGVSASPEAYFACPAVALGSYVCPAAGPHESHPDMARVHELKTRDDVAAMIQASHDAPVALLKHSVACPISARGQEQFVGLEAEGDPEMYAVVVQYARDLSGYLAETLGVQHETPQAIILKDGQPVFVQNHHRIKTAELREAAQEAAA